MALPPCTDCVRRAVALCAVLALLAGCTGGATTAPTSVATKPPVSVVPPPSTAASPGTRSQPTPAEPQATAAQAAPTVQVASTPAPPALPSTEVPALPPGLLSPTATPLFPSQAITPDSVRGLRLLRTIGFGEPLDASVAPAGRLLAVATTAGLALFRLPDLQIIRFQPRAVREVVLSPDAQYLVADGTLLRTADGRAIAAIGSGPIFSPDSQLIATSKQAPGKVTLWHSANGQPLRTINGSNAAFSADSTLVAVNEGANVELVRVADGQPGRVLPTPSPDITGLAFSSDDQHVLVAYATEVHWWQVTNGQRTRIVTIPTDSLSDPSNTIRVLSPAGDAIATSYQLPESPPSDVLFSNTLDGGRLSPAGAVLSDTLGNELRFSADGTAAVLWEHGFVASDQLRIVDLRLGTILRLDMPSFTSLAFSPDALTLAAASDSKVYVWRATDSVLQQTLDTQLGAFGSGQLRFSIDGRWLALAGDQLILYGDFGSQMVVWDLQAGGAAAITWNEYLSAVLAFGPPSTVFATRTVYGTPKPTTTPYLIDATQAISQALALPGDTITAALSPDGVLLAAGSSSGVVTLVDTSSGATQGTLAIGGVVKRLFFSPDGTLFGASREDGLVQLWRVGEAEPFARMAADPNNSLLITADNQMVLSGGSKGMMWYRTSDGSVVHTVNTSIDDIALGPRQRLLAILHNAQIELWGIAR